jgi:hypothetical protein
MSEPIAWTNKENLKYLQVARHANIWNQSVEKNDIPLYTHPMRELTEDTECKYCKQGCFRCDARKTLTDEEIIEVYKKVIESYGHDFAYTYARAILKKASEK